MQAGELRCPGCGASATPEATSCGFCHARLATVRCGACLGMAFIDARHCPSCGAALTLPDEGTPLSQPCPRCRTGLVRRALGEALLDECIDCGGVWVEANSFRRLMESREMQAAFAGEGSPLKAPVTEMTIETVRYVPCPACARLMQRINFARISGVIVDVCKGHGTWFDRDELRRVIEFVRTGGIERARDKERLDLEEERRRAKSAAPPDPALPIEEERTWTARALVFLGRVLLELK